MSGSQVNFEVTADTSVFDEALAASAATAKVAFAAIASAAQQSAAQTEAQLDILQAAALKANQALHALGYEDAPQLEAYRDALLATIDAIETGGDAAKAATEGLATMGASMGTATSSADALAAAQAEASAATVEMATEVRNSSVAVANAVDAVMNWDRSVLSASASAKVFENNLKTMGVSATETAIQMAELAAEQERLGSGLTNLYGTALQDLINTNLGVTKSFSDARQSAAAFTQAVDETGSGLTNLSGTALQELINTNLGVTKSFSDARQSAATFRQAFSELDDKGQVTAESLQNLAHDAEQIPTIMQGLNSTATAVATEGLAAVEQHGHMTSGVMREIIVEGRELITGNFSRMPGSLMVLAERFGGLTSAMMGWVAGGAIVLFFIADLTEHFIKVAAAARDAEAAMTLFNPDVTKDQVQGLASQLAELPGVTREMAEQGVADMARMQGASVNVMQSMADNARQMAEAMGITVPEALKKMADAYNDPAQAGRDLLASIGLNQTQLNQYDQVLQNQGPGAARVAILNDIARAADKVRIANDELALSTAQVDNVQEHYRGGVLDIPVQVSQTQQLLKLQQDLAAAQKDAAASNSVGGQPAGDSGAMDWVSTQTEALDQLKQKILDSGQDWQKVKTQEEQTDVSFWQGVVNRGNLSNSELATAKEHLFDAEQVLDAQTASAGIASSNQSTAAQIAALNVQQAAAQGNAQEIEEIEQQKLSILAAAYGEDSRQYQDELAKKVAADRAATAQELSSMKETLAAQAVLDKDASAEYKSGLQEQVAAGNISKEEMLTEYKSFIDQQNEGQLQSLSNLIQSLQAGTAEYAAAMKERAALFAQFQKTDDALQSQIDAAAQQSANKQNAAYTDMFQQIGSTARSEMNQLIDLNTTWGEAARRVYGTVLTSFADMALSMLVRWSATMLAAKVLNDSTMAAQVATQQAAGASGWGAIITQILTKMGIERAASTASIADTTATAAAQHAATATTTAAATTANAALAVQTRVNAVGQVQAAAAVAAANTFAATAAIPIVGPGLAPAAAAASLAQVEAYTGLASFAVGAWNLPNDMVAQVHAGEMIIPSDFASGLRNGNFAAAGGGGNSTSISYNPTVTASGGLQASDVQSMLNSQFNELVMYLQNMLRNGNLSLLGRT